MLIILTLMHISAMRFQSLFILMPLRISRSEIKLTQEKQFKQERRNLQHQELN
jgi:capsular polysaccharide biosynthesis protein